MLHVREQGLVIAKQATPIFKMAANDGSFAWSEGHGGRINQPIFTKIGIGVQERNCEVMFVGGKYRKSTSGFMRMQRPNAVENPRYVVHNVF